MKFKKPRGALLGIGFGSFVIAAVLFFLVPVICKEFKYVGLDAIVGGLNGLISFNFVNVLYTALVVLFVLAFALIVIYVIVAFQKKHGIHFLIALFSLIFIFGSYVLVSTYFLALDVDFNGIKTASDASLISLMLGDLPVIGKILSSLVIVFAGISNVLLVVHIFVALVSMVVTDEVKAFEEKCEEEAQKVAEEKAAELVASQPAVAPVVAEPVHEEVAVAKPVCDEDLEERKRKEMQLFKECVDSGYFTEYEELEFPEPIEGVEEEPVCEASIIEEKTAFISKQSIHVGYTHD